jgi:hypothetical protein
MKQSGLADSPLFPRKSNSEMGSFKSANTSSHPETSKESSQQPGHLDTMPPRYQATWIESIRKTVKEIGKEAATYRFTQAEKRSLLETVYSFTLKGNKTTENEITRIAVNFILQDFKTNKKESILDRVLESLRQ